MDLRPMSEPGAVRTELDRVGEVRDLIESSAEWGPPRFPDAREALAALAIEGSTLTASQLRLLLELLVSSRELAHALRLPPIEKAGGGSETERRPHLSRLRSRLPVDRDAEATLATIVDEEGAVRDEASGALRAIRRRLRSMRSEIVRMLERHARELPEAYRVEDASVSVRDGRFVIPVRREARTQIGGVVRGESSTGGTLFVEPPIAIQLTAELEELEREEAAEIQRILRDATRFLQPMGARLGEGFDAQVDFDSLWARARTAREWGAVIPEVVDGESGELRIEEGRHPLLLERGDDVVPFSIDLGPEERVVVISGPNTGGKTVLMKAIGLIHLLSQSGILPPVREGSRVGVMREVFADIGDEQSIAESLSTFSAHVENARRILRGAGPASLVLIDEMGTGTDPDEGAALARAILERLVGLGARVFVTSHLGALKRLDSEGSGIVNASLLFDPERLSPTFRFLKGRPGRSFGLAIARRLGIPEPVLETAESYLGSGERDVEILLESLQLKERELEAALAEAETTRRAAAELEAAVAAEKSRIDSRKRDTEREAREEARRILLEARSEVESALTTLRDADAEEREAAATSARRRVEEAAREQMVRTPRRPPRRTGALPALQVGDRARVKRGGASGIVRERAGDRVMVEVGGLRMSLPVDEVEPVEGAAEPTRLTVRATRGESAALPDRASPSIPASHEVDLRGLRVDEVELNLARALDGAIVENFEEVRIIHGKGSGAVKARVQELLKADSRIGAFRPGGRGEGGAGVTVAVLR
jgi:DNA mismatch repair protein MutS2